MRRETRLYNVILPIWMLLLFPQVWLIVIPGNLIVDVAVLLLALAALRHAGKGAVVRQLWWKLWLLGFAADAIGVAWMFLGLVPAFVMAWGTAGEASAALSAWENTLGHIMHDPFAHPAAFAWTLAGVALAGACIYLFDKRAMRGCPLLTPRERHVIALALAIVTAPWLFFIPMY